MSDNNIKTDTALGTYFTNNPTGILNYNSTNNTYESAGKNDIILTPKSASELELQKALENKIDCGKNSNVEKYYNYKNNYNNNYRNNYRNNYDNNYRNNYRNNYYNNYRNNYINNYRNKFLQYKSYFIFISILIIIILILIFINL